MPTDKQVRAQVTMTGPLERIQCYFAEFQASVEACRSADDASRPERLKNAYGALHRLRDRYRREKKQKRLSPWQQPPLEKVFEKDKFIESMMRIRQVSEHVVASEPSSFRTPDNVPLGRRGSFGGRDVRCADRDGARHGRRAANDRPSSEVGRGREADQKSAEQCDDSKGALELSNTGRGRDDDHSARHNARHLRLRGAVGHGQSVN